MRKFFAVFLVLLLLFSVIFCCFACEATSDGKPKIVVTIFPVYDWVMNVLGDRADDFSVTLLLDSGADLHSYQPSVADMVAVAEADLFLYVGGESDDWVDDALKNAVNKDMRTMDLLALLGDRAQYEEIVEGMEHEEEEEEEELEYDEHVWLSLRNAAFYVDLIAGQVAALDDANAQTYRDNATAYATKLSDLDARYAETVRTSPRDTILFGDRFPFRYLIEDYDLNYYAAFVGCSAETNASAKTFAFLSDKADELELRVILKLESSTDDIARGIVDRSATHDQEILVMDSLQSATKKEYADGRTYLAVMTENLSTLARALA